jgi:hypothetical protein
MGAKRKEIGFRLFKPDKALGGIGLFSIGGIKIQRFATFNDVVTADFKWLPDGNELLGLYSQKGPDYFQRTQIGLISDGGGHLNPITRDTNSYATLTLSGDGKTIATVQTKTSQNLYVTHIAENKAGEATAVLPQGQAVNWFDWTADGNLVFSDFTRLLRTGTGQVVPTRILGDPNAALVEVSGCGTHYLVFSWAFHGDTNSTNIWRANLDGSNPISSPMARTIAIRCARPTKSGSTTGTWINSNSGAPHLAVERLRCNLEAICLALCPPEQA